MSTSKTSSGGTYFSLCADYGIQLLDTGDKTPTRWALGATLSH